MKVMKARTRMTRAAGMVLQVVAVLVVMAAMVAMAAAMAGCSPTTGEWTDRGRDGLDNARKNVTAFYEMALKGEDAKLDKLVAASVADVKLARDGKLTDAETGLPVPLDDGWLAETEKGLVGAVRVWLTRRAKLQEMYMAAMGDLNATAECFDNVDRLNRAWADGQQVMTAQVQRLTAEIRQLRADQQAAKD